MEEELCCVCGNGFIDDVDMMECVVCGSYCHDYCIDVGTGVCFKCDCAQLDEEE